MRVSSIQNQPYFNGCIRIDSKTYSRIDNIERERLNVLSENIKHEPYDILVKYNYDNNYIVGAQHMINGNQAKLYFNLKYNKISDTLNNVINLVNLNK